MSKSHSQMAKELADDLTLSASPGTYSLGGNLTANGYAFSNTAITNNGAVSGTLGTYTITGGTGANTGPFTFSAGTNTQPWFNTNASAKIRLDGADADIEINGKSLMNMIEKIEQRLNILHPNEKLEAEWEELRALGEQYRALEQYIKDKQATWDKLKAMAPVVID